MVTNDAWTGMRVCLACFCVVLFFFFFFPIERFDANLMGAGLMGDERERAMNQEHLFVVKIF